MYNSREYMEYLPEYLREVWELIEIGNAVDPVTKLLGENNDKLLQEAYVETAEDYGLERLEAILGIESAENSIEVRRKEVLTRLRGETPYTFKSVYKKLVSICGSGNVSMVYGSEPYTLVVSIGVKGIEYIDIVRRYLKEVVPANIYIYCNIAYNTHNVLSGYTHEHLHSYKNSVLKEGVIE